MNKKYVIFTIIFLCILISFYIIFHKNKNNEVNNIDIPMNYIQNEITGEYIIYDKNGNVKTRVSDDVGLDFYLKNPEYDPKIDNDINVIE